MTTKPPNVHCPGAWPSGGA